MVTGAASEGAAGTPSSVPIPDPTDRTKQELVQRLEAERDYTDGQLAVILERLNGIDRATVLLDRQMTQVPTDVDKQVGQLKELHGEKFDSIAQQFRGNQVAIDAALSAQKEAASQQDESNAKAIEKSERATAETINKLERLSETRFNGLEDKIETNNKAQSEKIELLRKDLTEIRQLVNGAAQNKQGGSDAASNIRAMVGLAITVGFFAIAVIGFVVANKP